MNYFSYRFRPLTANKYQKNRECQSILQRPGYETQIHLTDQPEEHEMDPIRKQSPKALENDLNYFDVKVE